MSEPVAGVALEEGPRPELSVVIPVFRSERGLPELHARLSAALGELVGEHWEIVYVDDQSPDDSWTVLQQLKADDPRVLLIQLMRNSGQQRAVLCGLAHARGRFVVTMDDDLQHRPEEIRVLLEEIRRSGADVVMGSFERKEHGLIRGLGTALVKTVARVTVRMPRDLELTSFRILTQDVAQRVSKLRNPTPVVGFLLLAVSRNIHNVRIQHDPRVYGGSTYSFSGLVTYFAQMVLDYSDLPLRLVGYLGGVVALASFTLGGIYLFRYALGLIAVPGWVTVVLLLCFFSGLVLTSLGIIGVYLMRVLRSVNVGSTYDVRQRIR